ncbi:hypothetical protein N8T08_008450 [Aspergillus melleus]|uniref:Uncharacterized protein n=1 Tax=Aspergillus melleus TaxID=138277 RepID=A0ACC3AVY1_9EURO|nr:hypothetical protein N8T08_008450 [Aspergillus melleus]
MATGDDASATWSLRLGGATKIDYDNIFSPSLTDVAHIINSASFTKCSIRMTVLIATLASLLFAPSRVMRSKSKTSSLYQKV